MKVSRLQYAGSGQTGFTLLEMIVVLVLLALGAAIVAPSLILPHPAKSSEVRALVGAAREAAVRRGEMVRLRIDRTGAWRAVAGNAPHPEVLMSGRLADPPASVTDLLFSPLGTCAPSVESVPATDLAAVDPLTCEASPS